jgi:RNA polymerase-binding transcription factor DksA
MSKKNNKPDCDWEEIERLYRADLRTNAQLARDFDVHATTITRRAKKHAWKRDLKHRIKERANALVQERAVKVLASDDQTIEENAQITANVRLSHRQDIGDARSIAMTLLDDLKAQIGTDNRARLEDLFIAALQAEVVDASQLEAYERVTSLANHVRIMKELADTMTKLVTLERQAYGLDDMDSSPVDALTTLLHSIANNNGNAFAVVKDDPAYEDEPATNTIGVSGDDDA